MADRVIINRLLGLDEVGIYMVAVQLLLGLSIVSEAMHRAFVPWLFERLKRDDSHEKLLVVRGTYIALALVLICALVIALTAHWFVPLLAGAAYAKSAGVFALLAFAWALNSARHLVGPYIFYAQETKYVAFITIFTGLVHIAVAYWLIGLYGIAGAAFAQIFTAMLRLAATWVIANRVHAMPWKSGLIGGNKTLTGQALITGADGFIGSHLVEMALRAGYRVKALSQYNSFNNWAGWRISIVWIRSK